MEQIERVQGVAGANFLESLFHRGSGRLDALPDRFRNFGSLFPDPRLGVVEEFVKPALAENKLLIPECQVAKSKPDTHSRYDSDRQVRVTLLSVCYRLGWFCG